MRAWFALAGLVTCAACSPVAPESARPNTTADAAAHDAARDDDPAARPDVGPDSAAPGDAASEIGQDAGREAGLIAFGLDERPRNATCRAPQRPDAGDGGGIPAILSGTGCVDPLHPVEPAAGLIFYDVNAPLWSDGAEKRRWLALPDGAKIKVAADGDWDLPVGSVLVKTFLLAARPIETRLFVRHEDGDWAGYTYAWRDDGSDADLLPSSVRKTFGNQEWTYPSRENCILCHTKAAGGSLGLETAQLNRTVVYAKGPANQLATFEHIGLFETALPSPSPAFLVPTSTAGALDDRARAYLHANCANCHRPSGITEVSIDLRYSTRLADTRICDVEPAKGNFGFLGAKILKPGDPSLSMMSIRMHSVISGVLMPQIGRSLVDEDGVSVIDAFITALAGCGDATNPDASTR
jgi:uncharacterized repeat protein (TIGR03806 family)